MWFDLNTGNLLGGILGSVIGVLGGAWGAVAGVSAGKGRRKRLVLTGAALLIGTGVLLLGVAATALLTGQPHHVWYPFLLTGGLMTVCLTPNYISVKKLYVKAELKRMTVEDL